MDLITDRINLRLVLTGLFAVMLAACSGPPAPSEVFIPGPGVSTTVTIAVSAVQVQVDEPVTLYASRRSSGFVQVPLEEVPEGTQWWRTLPPSLEEEVADNLRWMVEPPGSAAFNTSFRPDHTRQVRFSLPGSYTLTGWSSFPGPEPVRSNTVTLRVVP